jgi:hypothetical protein
MQGTGIARRAVSPRLLTPAPLPVHAFIQGGVADFKKFFRPVSIARGYRAVTAGDTVGPGATKDGCPRAPRNR